MFGVVKRVSLQLSFSQTLQKTLILFNISLNLRNQITLLNNISPELKGHFSQGTRDDPISHDVMIPTTINQ